jgi:hypothetical protein
MFGGLTQTLYGMFDTGADDTVFPKPFAVVLGIDPTHFPTGVFQGVGKNPPIPVFYARVLLRLDDGKEVFEWEAVVGFADIKNPLLGITGCLEYFDTQFLGSRKEVILQPNAAFRGTVQQIP